ncbi:MAG: HNH endonuclease [Christensenellales bacterium]|jgi:5-methylcytosine-specific restriction protein A
MRLLTVQEILKETGIARATLYRMIDEGLPFETIGANRKVFELDKVNSFIAMRKNAIANELVVGNEYLNDDSSRIFKCSTQGGMRRSHSTLALVLTSHHEDPNNAYIDYWRDNIFYYTGMGMEGEQGLTYAQNKTLAESNSNGIVVYLFEVFSNQKYTYRGIAKLVAEPFQKVEIDFAGNPRNVWKFPLKLMNHELLDNSFIRKEQQILERSIAPISDIELSKKVHSFDGIARSRRAVTRTYEYNLFVREYVNRRANGHCELCGNPAPFSIGNKPFLKTYHLTPLSQDGADTPSNISALCPNCYEKLKMLRPQKDLEFLKLNSSK